jgi:uncharacterized protein YcfJ
MKTSLIFCLALLVTGSAAAQGLRPEAVNGAVWGGVAGAIIGNNSGDLRHNAWRGAAIGAGTGLLLGSIVGENNDYRTRTQVRIAAAPRTYLYRQSGGYYGRGGFYGYAGYGRGWRHSYYDQPGYVYIDSGVYGYPTYDDGVYARPNYAANGAVLGALAGAVIGNNSGDLRHKGWRGAAYGAAAGYLLGSIAENNARRREAVLTEQAAAPVVSNDERARVATPAISSQAATVTTTGPRPTSSMSAANSLFGR